MKLTAKRLRELLHYNPETGIWTRLVERGRNRRYKVGSIVGSLNKQDGYISIRLENKLYLGHRLAWFYMTGSWPKHQIDHANLRRSDNRWCNLREATHGQNVQNSSMRCTNTTGYKGASKFCTPCNLRRPYRARITINKKEKHLGSFATAEEAHNAYLEAAKKYYGKFARAK